MASASALTWAWVTRSPFLISTFSSISVRRSWRLPSSRMSATAGFSLTLNSTITGRA
jgi:hypothetical protein